MRKKRVVVGAAPTQSWEAEHSEKALLTEKGTKAGKPTVDLKLMGEETADMAVPEGKHGSVSVDDRPHRNLKVHGTCLCY